MSTAASGGGGKQQVQRREWKNLSDKLKKQLYTVGREGPMKLYGFQSYDPLLGEGSVDFVSAEFNINKNVIPKGRIMTIPVSWYREPGHVRPYNKGGGRRQRQRPRKTRRAKKEQRSTRRR